MTRWPLVGRDQELRYVDEALRGSGHPRGILLAGSAGVGKTRLAGEAVRVAAQRGSVTHWVSATNSSLTIPFGAFGQWTAGAPADPLQGVRDITRAMLRGGSAAGVVIAVDDAHLLDQQSAFLVHQLVTKRLAAVVLTVRTGERAPDAVTALWKDAQLARLDLQPLSAAETAAIMEAVLGGPVEDGSASRMFRLCGGNTLYLRHLVEDERAAGRLQRTAGVWLWRGRPGVSAGLSELVATRIGELSEPVRTVMDLLALSEPLDVGILSGLVDVEAVEQAETRGLIRVEVEAEGREVVRLAHPLYGEVQRAAMGRLRARRLRGDIARSMADDGPLSVRRALRLSVLALDSDLAPDAAVLGLAAGGAIALLDLALAERLARAAVAAGAGFDAHLALANSLSWLNRGVESEQELRVLEQLATTDVERVRVALPRAANLFYTLGRPAAAQRALDDAEAALTDPGYRGVITAVRAALHVHLGRPEDAVAGANEALSGPLPDVAVMLATFGLVGGLGLLGRADDIGGAADRAYAAGRRSYDAAVPCYGLGYLHILALTLAGYPGAAGQVAADLTTISLDIPGPPQLYAAVLRGHAALAGGRLRTSIRAFSEAGAGLGSSDTSGFETHALMGLTTALAMAGDAVGARTRLAELNAQHPPVCTFLEPERMLAGAWVVASEGSITEAIRIAHEAAGVAAQWRQRAHEVLALHTAARWGDRTVASRLAELAATMQGPRAAVVAAHAAAVAADDGAALHGVSKDLEHLGDLLGAADAEAQACEALLRRDRRGPARLAAARAHQLAQNCEGSRTPALMAAAKPLPLTGREREIFTMAAAGLSNRDIADRLTVSVRTVEGHLYRVNAKLGTSHRSEFAEMLRIV